MKVLKTTVKRQKRSDDTLQLTQSYSGELHNSPATYNAAMASVLRVMADKIETVTNAYVDPEIVVWMHVRGLITAEAMLSPTNNEVF